MIANGSTVAGSYPRSTGHAARLDGAQPQRSPGDSARVGLPRTRSFRRKRQLGRWWVAVLVALLANLAVVVGLSRISHLHHATIEPPLSLRTLRQTVPDEPPPPPPPQAVRPASEPSTTPIALTLPSLDLPDAPIASALALPTVGSLDIALDLPIALPAIATTEIAAVGPAAGAAAFDSPAERESAFDLDRYYPRSARLRGVEGTTRIRITVDATGRVSAVQILDSRPAGVFDEAAERLCRGLRYRPARSADQPVGSIQDTTIEWTIRR